VDEMKKGGIPWNKGKKNIYSEETKKEMGKNSIGKIPWNKGLKGVQVGWNKGLHMWEGKENPKGMLGKIGWNKGLTKETDERIDKYSNNQRKTMLRRYKDKEIKPWNKGLKGIHFSPKTEFKKGIVSIMKGKTHTDKSKEKIKIARAKQIFPLIDTSIEIKIQSFLKQLNIDFLTHQYIKDIEHGYQCDILIPSMNLVIECDGNYWHKYPIGNDIDHIRTKELLENGFKVLRLWEFEINEMTIDKFKERIK
jgi:very-short-patch-repair endonuclease